MTVQAPTRRRPPGWTAWRFGHPDLGDDAIGFSITPTGRIALVQDLDVLRQALMILLSTRPGERVMRPDYGCDLSQLVFSPNDDTTAGLAIHYVRRAVERFEPRVAIMGLDAGRAPDDPASLEVVLDYRPSLGGPVERLVLAVPLEGSE